MVLVLQNKLYIINLINLPVLKILDSKKRKA